MKSINEIILNESMNAVNKIVKRISKLCQNVTSKKYTDEYWQGVSDVRNIISSVIEDANRVEDDLVYDYYMNVEGTGYNKNKDGQEWKEYKIHLLKNGVEEYVGTLTCMPAGTVEDKWSSYDMAVMF